MRAALQVMDGSGQAPARVSVARNHVLPFEEPRSYRWQPSRALITEVNVLAQPRKTFTGIKELAETVATYGYANPPNVARFTREEAIAYLEEVNAYWGSAYAIEDLRPREEDGLYDILIAGERRFRSGMHLHLHGCQKCRQAHGQEEHGHCLHRHFGLGPGVIEVRVPLGIRAEEAFGLQLMENTTQCPVPAHEQAHSDTLWWQYLKRKFKRFSLKTFARLTGRSVTALGRAFRFHDLPLEVQVMVEERKITYGVASELARLWHAAREGVERPITEERLLKMAQQAAESRFTRAHMKGWIDREILERRENQLDLLSIMMNTYEQEEMERQDHRRVVAAQMSGALWRFKEYLSHVLRFREEERKAERSALTLPSTLRNAEEFARLQRQMIDCLRDQLTEKEIAELERAGMELLNEIAAAQEALQPA